MSGLVNLKVSIAINEVLLKILGCVANMTPNFDFEK